MFPKTRLRRPRSNRWIRNIIRDTALTKDDLVMPFFVTEGSQVIEPIPSMPNVFRYSTDSLIKVVAEALEHGLKVFAIFPVVPANLKTPDGKEAYNPENLACRTLKALRGAFGQDLALISDVALDPYTTHGHDGIMKDGRILNDETLEILAKQSLTLAAAGCDVIAPSDMMDGRVDYIRRMLDISNFTEVMILSYAAKYASSFYKPFRGAIGSEAKGGIDKSTYQMDFANQREAMREIRLDLEEGADFVLIKPAMLYLDIISSARREFDCPIFAYQVSGEYSMLAQDVDNMYESLIAIKRAGCNAIFTYAALELMQKRIVT